MENFKKSAYTFILIATFFLASPFMIAKIWKSSSETKKVDSPVAAAENSTNNEVVPEKPTENNTDNEENPVDEQQLPENTVSEFITSDASYFDDALFIGDSRTVGIMEYGSLQNADYFCSIGLQASQIDDEVIDGVTFEGKIDSKQYGKIYIMLGINEVGNDQEYTLTAYRAMVEKIKVHQPDALIYLQSNLHVTSWAETESITNSSIDSLNSRIATLADNKRVFYLDINEIYDNAYGCLDDSCTSDGIHPFAKYYTQWCEWLCTKTIVQEENNNPDVIFMPPQT